MLPQRLELTRAESKGSLLESLRTDGPYVIVGAAAEAPREFFQLLLSKLGEGSIGIISSGHGVTPVALLDQEIGRVIIGHDREVSSVSLRAPRIIFSTKIPSVFFEFVEMKSDGSVVLVHELGVLEIDPAGQKRWALDTDAISRFSRISDGHIQLEEMESAHAITVSLLDGTRIAG